MKLLLLFLVVLLALLIPWHTCFITALIIIVCLVGAALCCKSLSNE